MEFIADHLAVIMFAVLTFIMFVGYPVAFVLGAIGIVFGWLGIYFGMFAPVQFANLLPRIYGQAVENQVLVAVPMFIFMGVILEKSGVAEQLLSCLQILFRKIPGGLALAVVLLGTIMAATTGIVGASVVMLTLIALPIMLERGYSKELSVGTIAASGTLGILIPPSIMLVIVGDLMQISVGLLFAAAVLPGLMLSGLYVIYIIILSWFKPHLAPPLGAHEGPQNASELMKMVVYTFSPPAFLILLVLGSIFGGWATPTEAAAMGSLGGLILAAAYRRLNIGMLRESVYLTAKTSAMVCWLFVGSSIFSAAFALLGGQDIINQWVLSLDLTPLQFMILAQVVIFLLGWPLEWTEIIVIFMPIFIPLLPHFNIDPLFFGLLVALNLQTAFLSPPVAMAAFYLKGVAPPHVTLNQIFLGMMPFMVIQVIALVMLYVFPDIGLWLPRVLYK